MDTRHYCSMGRCSRIYGYTRPTLVEMPLQGVDCRVQSAITGEHTPFPLRFGQANASTLEAWRECKISEQTAVRSHEVHGQRNEDQQDMHIPGSRDMCLIAVDDNGKDPISFGVPSLHILPDTHMSGGPCAL